MVQSYKQKYEAADHYDVILIGSGMGCQAAGACLAKEGQKVLILERPVEAAQTRPNHNRNGTPPLRARISGWWPGRLGWVGV